MTYSLLAFVIAALLLTITPGLDSALVLRTAASRGARAALMAGVGIATGCIVWGAVVAVGLGALLQASQLAYDVLKWAGAAYLAYLGVRMIWNAARAGEPNHGGAPPSAPRESWFRIGLLTNVLNPKVGVFYVSFLPQFIPPGVEVVSMTMLLAVIHALLGIGWFVVLVAATARVASFVRRPSVTRWLDRLVGGVFLLFAARLATSRA